MIPRTGRCIVLFTGAGCPSCGPMRELLAGECSKAGLKLVEVNAQEHPRVAARYHIQSVPTAIKVDGGHIVGVPIGGATIRKKLAEWVRG